MTETLVPSTGSSARWFKSAVALAIAGFLYSAIWSGWLLAHPLDSLAGCGGNGGCAAVLSSRWSKVFGLPVTIPAAAVYLGLLGSLLLRRKNPVLFFSVVLLSAVLWFLALQTFVLRAFCPLCLGAHAIGLLAGLAGTMGSLPAKPSSGAWRLPLAGALSATAMLVLIQTFGPAPASHRVTPLHGSSKPDSSVHALGGGRVISFANGGKKFAVESLPHLGDPEAPHVLVEYLDYQCAACRVMHGHLSALLSVHPGKVCLIVLPVPLEEKCNPHVPRGQISTPGSCHLARLALAVWRSAPQKFPEIHQAFFADPSPSDPAAERLARGLIPEQSWPGALSDPWIDHILSANIQDWRALSSGGPKLPKVLLGESKVLHGLPSGREEFLRVIAKELGL